LLIEIGDFVGKPNISAMSASLIGPQSSTAHAILKQQQNKRLPNNAALQSKGEMTPATPPTAPLHGQATVNPVPMPASPATAAKEEVACWTSNRNEIRSWLQRNAPSLAELYEGAVILLYEQPLPGRTRYIAHAVREIRNRLPDVIGGPAKKQRLDYTSRIDEIAKLPEAQALISNHGGKSPPATTTITIDEKLAKKLIRLLQDHHTTRAKPLDAARRLF